MPDYKRVYVEGGTYFFTVNTIKRKTILTRPESRYLLKTAWQEIKKIHPFEDVALCLMPDHIHCIWKLPENDSNFSVRWNGIKGLFSKKYKKTDSYSHDSDRIRKNKQEASVWQRRFWEHLIRDDDDLQRHIDYIHYNPVKHGYVAKATDWEYSTIHRYIHDGIVEPDWGNSPLHDKYEFLYDYD